MQIIASTPVNLGFHGLFSEFRIQTSAFPLAALGFVTAGFAAAGLIAASIPIIIHILNRRRFKIVTWAAMDFLLNAMKKNRRRLKFEQWLLLATRCLVLALLGLALARPLGCEKASLAIGASRSGLHVFVIDNSYSMSYDTGKPSAPTHLAQAKNLAKQAIDRLQGGESVVIITAGRPAAAVGGGHPVYDLNAAKATIDRIEQSAGATDVNGALQLALQIGKDETRQPIKYLYLMTDGTKSAWEGSAAAALKQTAADLASIYKIKNFNLAGGQQTNMAAVDLTSGSNLVTTKFTADFRVTGCGYGPNLEAPLLWKVDGEQQPGGKTVKLDLKKDHPETLSNIVFKTGGPHVISTSLAGGDRLNIDDTRWLVTQVASELKVLIVEGERGMNGQGGSGSFLQMALSPPSSGGAPRGNVKTDSYVSCESISALELSGKVLSDYGAVIMTDVGQVTAGQADHLANYVKAGGTVMWFMGEQVSSDNYNQMLVPRKLLPGVLAKRMAVGSDQPGFRFDFKPHTDVDALLHIFSNEERSGLDTAQVFTYWQLALPNPTTARTVLRYLPSGTSPATRSEGDPAITTHALGEGRVVFYSTTAGPEWTSFPAKPAWLTLMHELLSGSVVSGDEWMNRVVGQSVEVPATVQFTGQPQLLDPSKKVMVLEPAPVGSSLSFKSEPLMHPGVYSIVAAGKTIPIAVNVPGDEADVRTVDNNAIKSAMGGIEMELLDDQLPPESEMAQAGNDFGWTVMVVVLCMAGLECFMAMQFGHTRRTVVKA